HYLGRVQRNKVGKLAPFVDCWQSVGRLVEAEAIVRHADGTRPPEIFVEVNLERAPDRPGAAPEDVPRLVTSATAAGCHVRGLMAVGALAGTRSGGGTLRFELVTQLSQELGLTERSIGMSDDLEAAVAAGTTMVRIGRALFGERSRESPRAPFEAGTMSLPEEDF
ncbi:MAG: alanine racemase, partial [Acidimicrobiales bacterium]